MTIAINEQVTAIMHGADLGDATLKSAMQEALRERLELCRQQGRPLHVYAGYDPSRPDLHIGHSITLRKLRQFQDFGHNVSFVVGTYTAQVGDNSDKATGRPRRTEEEVTQAARTYAEQCFRILDRDKTNVRFNSDWLSQVSLSEFTGVASNFTVQQFLARDNIRKRLESNDRIGLHEFFYALLQAYDAYYLNVDVQLGATEQLFNIMAGRKLQEALGKLPLICITYPVLVGTDGKARMSKTAGNYVGLSESAVEQYGKTMSISDETMCEWIKYVTRWSPAEIDEYIRQIQMGEVNPMHLKKKLAWELASIYHGNDAADQAQANFEQVHQQRGQPSDIPVVEINQPLSIVDALTSVAKVKSRSQARRLIEGGGVQVDDQTVKSADEVIENSALLRVGKRQFFKIVIR